MRSLPVWCPLPARRPWLQPEPEAAFLKPAGLPPSVGSQSPPGGQLLPLTLTAKAAPGTPAGSSCRPGESTAHWRRWQQQQRRHLEGIKYLPFGTRANSLNENTCR